MVYVYALVLFHWILFDIARGVNLDRVCVRLDAAYLAAL